MPLKYKLALLTTSLILLLFIGYSLLQYNSVTQWMMDSQKDTLQRTAGEISGYFAEQEEPLNSEGLDESKRFMERFVQNDQLFRLLDSSGQVVLVLSNNLPADWIPVLVADKESITELLHGQDRLLVVRAPIDTAAFKGSMELVTNLENIDAMKNRLRSLMLTFGALGVIVSMAGGYIVARSLLKPLNRMASAMNVIKQTGVSGRIGYRNNGDEISRLSSLFNEMMDELERSFNRQRQFIEDASHEFRTPIAIIEGHLKLLNRWGKNDPAVQEESIAAAIEEIVRLRKLSDQLLDLSEETQYPNQTDSEPIDPERIAIELIRNYRMLYPQFTIEAKLTKGLHINVDGHHLHQLLIILLDNAIRYSAKNHYVKISILDVGEHVQLSVEDKGIGIDKKDIPFVFDRFFRVDKGRGRNEGGSGLGLSIAKRLTEKYGGEIRVESNVGLGTKVTLVFPLL
ncbi:sensor histidine kinase [Cohnella zeiphila]|uniref:Signal transduction histidine-protein kinase ArlS n=1 Tax=Cohnella zeiphila TaxID=2761120 RepID=A0A7X0SMH8_9BACL|nr:HAMP domain-containing histidine kinase [Cohnella zeiphila]MBB6732710.1 HAMP domain-containing sensor histidine kinase [Cohnella zeiphila]